MESRNESYTRNSEASRNCTHNMFVVFKARLEPMAACQLPELLAGGALCNCCAVLCRDMTSRVILSCGIIGKEWLKSRAKTVKANTYVYVDHCKKY